MSVEELRSHEDQMRKRMDEVQKRKETQEKKIESEKKLSPRLQLQRRPLPICQLSMRMSMFSCLLWRLLLMFRLSISSSVVLQVRTAS